MGLASALSDRGHNVYIIAGDIHTDFPEIQPTSPNVNIKKIKWLRIPLLNLSYPLGLMKYLKEFTIENDSFIHNNLVWSLEKIRFKKYLIKSHSHLICCPRGNLLQWCFKSKNWKKRPFWNFIGRNYYNLSDFIHVTSQEEMNDLRALGVNVPMVLISNATDIPSESYVAKHISLKEKKLLFLSRISKKKGLELLLNAWAKMKRPGWKLIIAGTDSEGYSSFLKQLSNDLNISNSVEFIGGVAGQNRDMVYAQADIFILPTFSENYGLVIAEALAHGLPVITTKGTPWKDIVDNKCGWWCDINEEAIVNALNEAMLLTNQDRKAMGQRGREYVIKEHSWQSAADKMETSCSYVLKKRNLPKYLRDK